MRSLIKAIGQRTRRAREEMDLTQEQVAERAGLHVSYVGQIERGLREPSLKSLVSITHALNLELVDIFTEGGDKEDRLLRELRRVIGTLEPPQQRQVLGIVRQVVGLAEGQKSRR